MIRRTGARLNGVGTSFVVVGERDIDTGKVPVDASADVRSYTDLGVQAALQTEARTDGEDTACRLLDTPNYPHEILRTQGCSNRADRPSKSALDLSRSCHWLVPRR